MKFNKISMVLAALAFVGCSSEDLNEFSATPAVEDSNLIQLGSDFVLAGVGADGTTTRTHWEQDATTKALVNKFLPIYNDAAVNGAPLNTAVQLEKQAVGLCWLGQTPGAKVYTNYQFYHFGWLNNGETEAKVECDKLKNGAFYSDLSLTADGNEGDEANPEKFAYTSGSADAPKDKLNFNTGVYKTENKAIFGGQYIVYYPYNQDFKDAGTIPAVAQTNWETVPTNWKSKEIGEATFRYSAPVDIVGGNQAADFGLYNLSSIAQLRVASVTGEGCIGQTIDQIVLFSESKGLLKKAYLAADKIAAGATGADLYAETEGTKTIVASNANIKLKDKEATDITSAYITVLPTTVDDLVAFVHNANGKWAKIAMGNTVFKAGSAKRLDIVVKDADFTTDYIAVDHASLETALTSARAEVTADADAEPIITVIGDITITNNYTNAINTTEDANITIKGDDIIVPEDVTLYLNTNMESNVRVLGKSCCSGNYGGRLYVSGGTISNVTLEKTEATASDDNNPMLTYEADVPSVVSTATVAAGKTVDVQAGKVVVNMAVQHKGDIKIAKGVNVTVNGKATNNTGELNFMGSNVTNDGTIEVKKDGKFDMTAKNGGATAEDGKRMTNNGTFIHNIDAGVGTAVQSMVQNGEYRCRVNKQTKLDDAYQQWTACSVIEMVNSTNEPYDLGIAESNINYQHNGKYIDIEVNGSGTTTFTNNTPDNKEIMVGNLTVKKGTLNINFVTSVTSGSGADAVTTTGKRTLTVNGNMTVAATTNMNSSKKINITKNLTVNSGKTLKYAGNKGNEDGLAVTKDINVTGTFNAGDVNALNITCANFTVNKNGKAYFGNRTDGASKNMVVSNTINNKTGGEFDIKEANQNGAGSVLAWVSCKELKVGGTFTGARPRVVE